jgi:hypothetical protein
MSKTPPYQRGPKDQFVTKQSQIGQLHVGGGGAKKGGGSKQGGCLWMPFAAVGPAAIAAARAKGWA